MAQEVLGVHVGQGSGSLSYTAGPQTPALSGPKILGSKVFVIFFTFGSATFKPVFLGISKLLTDQNLTLDRPTTFLAASREVQEYGEVRIRLGF